MGLRVVIAEDSVLMREGIGAVLALDEGFEVVAQVGDYEALMNAAETHHPDVVLTDIRMPPSQTDEGIRAALAIRDADPAVGVVVLSQHIEPSYALRLFSDGSEGKAYLLKERVADPADLAAAIRAVSRGGSVVDPRVVDALVAARSKGDSVLSRLTERELEVLAEVAKGGNNTAVAEALFISPRSVEKHINSIFTKLDLSFEEDTNRRVRAVLLYLAETTG